MIRSVLTAFLLMTTLCSTGKGISGTNDEVVSGVRATIRNPDATPAAGASVKLFSVGDTLCAYATMTDATGEYLLDSIPAGRYNIWSHKDLLAACQDSVVLNTSGQSLPDDTLGIAFGYSSTIGMQPGHDPRTVSVRIMGSEQKATINTDGNFLLSGLPIGRYTLGLFPTLPGYSTTFYPVSIGLPTKVDTMWVKYTIPSDYYSGN